MKASSRLEAIYIAEPKVTVALPTSARTMDQEEELNGQNTANGYSQLC